MANNNAFTHVINPIGSGAGEHNEVHQVSPTWVLTFVRWSLRDTLRTKPTPNLNYQTVRDGDPLVVENDCIQLSVVVDKGTLTDSMTATLKMTDVNYETVISPGDFVIVNILNWPKDARRVADNARARKSINNISNFIPIPHSHKKHLIQDDGFKGVFKVQGVRKVLGVDPESGKKAFFIKITGFSFTELNNVIYFNPELIFSNEKNDALLFVSNIANNWDLLQNNKVLTNVQDIVEALIDSFLGTGIGDTGKTVKGQIVKSPNTLFYVPPLLGTLLGAPQAKAAKDVYNFLFGIQQYSSGSQQTLARGMNPTNFQFNNSRIWKPTDATSKCRGETYTKPGYWDQVTVWSIFNQFSNSPINEMFTCFRVSPSGHVMPTMIFRQIPFTTSDFRTYGNRVTRFMQLPRWKIHPSLITQFDIGRDESARINFVQYYGRATLGPNGWDYSSETAQKNYLYDIDDVKRSGLRPKVVSSSFDELTKTKSIFEAPIWAKILGDAVIGGQLKMGGTIETHGIVDPIAIGDNLELDGVVYHIERVAHTCTIEPDSKGTKIFRSQFGLSHGLSKDTSSKGVAYPEMSYGSAYNLRNVDWANNKILPGVSESQDVVYRPVNLDLPHSTGGQFKQPNLNTSTQQTGVENQFGGTPKEKDKK